MTGIDKEMDQRLWNPYIQNVEYIDTVHAQVLLVVVKIYQRHLFHTFTLSSQLRTKVKYVDRGVFMYTL